MTTGHHTKTAVQHCIIMLQNNGKAEWNRQMGCGVGARSHRETFTWWSRNLKFGFRLQSPGLWGKRVNLLRDERCLPYVHIIILVCLGVGRGRKGTLDPLDFETWKTFIFWIGVGKIKFNNSWSPGKNVSTGNIHYCPFWRKPSDALARLRVHQGFSYFFTNVPLSIKYII